MGQRFAFLCKPSTPAPRFGPATPRFTIHPLAIGGIDTSGSVGRVDESDISLSLDRPMNASNHGRGVGAVRSSEVIRQHLYFPRGFRTATMDGHELAILFSNQNGCPLFCSSDVRAGAKTTTTTWFVRSLMSEGECEVAHVRTCVENFKNGGLVCFLGAGTVWPWVYVSDR